MSSLSHARLIGTSLPASSRGRIGRWAFALCVSALLIACGGGSSGNSSTVPLPVATAPVTEPSRSVSASIGADGGSITATGSNGVAYTLVIPPGGLAAAVDIRLTPISDLGGSPLARGLLGAVQMEPSGLTFLRAAKLRIGAVAALAAGERLVGFGSANNGSLLGLKFATVVNGATEIDVAHFSTGGGGTLSPAEFAKLIPLVAPNPVDQFWDDLMRLPMAQLDDSTVGPPAAALFRSWYLEVVKPALEAELLATPKVLVNPGIAAYELWLQSRVRFEELTNGNSSATRLLADVDAQARGLVAQLLIRQIDLAIADCARLSNIRTLSEAQLYQNMAVEFVMNTTALGLGNARFLTKVNTCLRPVLDPIKLPTGLKVGSGKSLDARAQVVFNGQPNPVAAPFVFTVMAVGSTPQTTSGRSDAAGRFTTVFTPNAPSMQFTVKACLVLDLISITEGSDICVQQSVSATIGFVILSGSFAISNNHALSDGSFDNYNFAGSLRVRVGADSTVTVISGSGAENASTSLKNFCDGLTNTVKFLNSSYSSAFDSVSYAFRGSSIPTSILGIAGDFEFVGPPITRLAEQFTPPAPQMGCQVETVTSTAPAGLALRVISILRDNAGMPTTIIFDQTLRTGAVITGRLMAGP